MDSSSKDVAREGLQLQIRIEIWSCLGFYKRFWNFHDCGKSSRKSSFKYLSSKLENLTFEGQASPGIFCSSLNLSNGCNISGGSWSERSIEVKKSKTKKKKNWLYFYYS